MKCIFSFSKLLCHLLNIEPTEAITFKEFFKNNFDKSINEEEVKRIWSAGYRSALQTLNEMQNKFVKEIINE